MDKRVLWGVVVLGAAAAAFFLWPKKASAEEMAYVKQLSTADLQGIVQAMMAGVGYANLSAEQVKQLSTAAQAELVERSSDPASRAAAMQRAVGNQGPVAANIVSMAQKAAAARGVPVIPSTFKFPGAR